MIFDNSAAIACEMHWDSHVLRREDSVPFSAADKFMGLIDTRQWNDAGMLVSVQPGNDLTTVLTRKVDDEEWDIVYTFNPVDMMPEKIEYRICKSAIYTYTVQLLEADMYASRLSACE